MRYVISVGANLGDAIGSVKAALANVPLRLHSDTQQSSALYSTSPVGGPDQADFVNAVIVVDSPLKPTQVLRELQRLEQEAQRVRDVRWGPRTLDLDIITAGNSHSDDPDLTLPHPRAHERGFVLMPWFEVEPKAELSGHGPVEDLIARLDPDQRVVKIQSGEEA
jgi:2-amino-4-hydroxy-6-hydroxymethyldihydropteridine diphosphokinase